MKIPTIKNEKQLRDKVREYVRLETELKKHEADKKTESSAVQKKWNDLIQPMEAARDSDYENIRAYLLKNPDIFKDGSKTLKVDDNLLKLFDRERLDMDEGIEERLREAGFHWCLSEKVSVLKSAVSKLKPEELEKVGAYKTMETHFKIVT